MYCLQAYKEHSQNSGTFFIYNHTLFTQMLGEFSFKSYKRVIRFKNSSNTYNHEILSTHAFLTPYLNKNLSLKFHTKIKQVPAIIFKIIPWG